MLRHFLITTLRVLGANRLQSAIAIFGLSLGLAAAILDGLLIANQLSFDHFISGNGELYFAAMKNIFQTPLNTAEYTFPKPWTRLTICGAKPARIRRSNVASWTAISGTW